MAQEAAVPKGFWAKVEKLIDDKIAAYARSGPLRNATISGGAGLTIDAGGKAVVRHPDGKLLMLMGTYDLTDAFNMPDGSRQPMALIYRADGSLALSMYDPDPAAGGFQQFLALWDRSGKIIMSDDTDSGQGLARPYIGGSFAAHRFTDFRYSTTSPTFETVASWWVRKQQPRLMVTARASMDTGGTTGEMRVLVNDVPLGATSAEAFAISTRYFGPAPIAGAHMDRVFVELQGRRTSASGVLKLEPMGWEGQQS